MLTEGKIVRLFNIILFLRCILDATLNKAKDNVKLKI